MNSGFRFLTNFTQSPDGLLHVAQGTFVYALENENKVWQKVKNYLSADNAVASVQGSSPAAQNAFLGLRQYLSQQRRNFDLQFVPFTAEDMNRVDGIMASVASPCRVYGVYARTRSTQTATAAFFALGDAATTDATTTTMLTTRFNAAKQAFVYINPMGLPFATTILAASSTAVAGDTATEIVDSPDGFLILGGA